MRDVCSYGIDLLRIGHGQLRVEHLPQQSENRGCEADSSRKQHHRDQCKRSLTPQTANADQRFVQKDVRAGHRRDLTSVLRQRVPDIHVPFPRAVFLLPDDDVFHVYVDLGSGNAQFCAPFFNQGVSESLHIDG